VDSLSKEKGVNCMPEKMKVEAHEQRYELHGGGGGSSIVVVVVVLVVVVVVVVVL